MTAELIKPGTGIVLHVSMGIDLTSNTGLSLAIRSPVTKTETDLTGGTIDATDSTYMNYPVAATDFTEVGIYQIVGVAAFIGAPALYGTQDSLNVVDKFNQ